MTSGSGGRRTENEASCYFRRAQACTRLRPVSMRGGSHRHHGIPKTCTTVSRTSALSPVPEESASRTARSAPRARKPRWSSGSPAAMQAPRGRRCRWRRQSAPRTAWRLRRSGMRVPASPGLRRVITHDSQWHRLPSASRHGSNPLKCLSLHSVSRRPFTDGITAPTRREPSRNTSAKSDVGTVRSYAGMCPSRT